MPLYLTQSLHRAVQRSPQRTATICGTRRYTYRQHADRVARLAGALQSLGMARGDRIGMLALNGDRYLEFFFGTWWGGGAVNPVNIRWSAAEIAYSLDDCDTRILLVDEQFKGLAAELRSRSTSLQTLVYTGDGDTPDGMLNYEALLAAATPAVDAGCGGQDLAGVMYTGGTTGFPKGVMLSHEGLCANALAFVGEGIVQGDARTLLIAPMFHIACGAMMLGNAAVGGTFVIAPMFTPLGTLQVIQEQKVTHTLLVPTMIQLATDHPDADQYDLSSVQSMAYGGSVISEAVLQRAMKRFPSAGFFQAYGMTELSPCATYLSPADHRGDSGKPGLLRSAGRASLSTEVRIVDEQGREVPLGTVGEVAVRGPNVMLGYWNKPEQTAAAVRDGWMHTGDGGRMDEDGYRLHRRPHEGHDRQRRRERLFGRGRERAVAAPGGGRQRGHRHPQRAVGRGGARGGGAQARRQRRGRGTQRALPPADRRLQVPAHGGVSRRAADDRRRQDPEDRTAQAVLGRAEPGGELSA